MILKSRETKSRLSGLYRMVRPQKSYLRTLKYWAKRILRIRATPHALALGFSIGIFAAFSPALGVHFLIALALSFLLGGNLVAASLGTIAANPLTFPFMIASEFQVGASLFGNSAHRSVSTHEILAKLTSFDLEGMWEPVFKPLFAGSVVLGLAFAAAAYFLIFYFASVYEYNRAERRRRREVMLP